MKKTLFIIAAAAMFACAASAQTYDYVLTKGNSVSSVKWVETAVDGGKTIDIKGYVMTNKRFAPGTFAFGRDIMTCCAADIQYCSLIANWDANKEVEVRSWYQARFKVDFKFHRLYGCKGPVLNIISMEKTTVPDDPVATFY